ncbi:hypothetical protein HDF18_12235 [Mucilaginibacter sp. X5P1]|nr:hypothetical protein [Mucilaginibacter sp. X5P1]MBB6140410.1 hypothetical protein [Mucilaginibacter sp. X5P1]
MHTERFYNQWFLGNPAKIPVNGGKMPTNEAGSHFHRHPELVSGSHK